MHARDHGEAERRRTRAVDDAMVEGDREGSGAPHDDLTLADDRARCDPADAQDRDLRMVDDRGLEEAGELAGARHRERRAAELLCRKRSRPRSLCERGDFGPELVDGLLVRVPDDRHHESVVGLHRNPEVIAVEVQDRVAVEAGVQLGELEERVRAGLDDGRKQRVEWNALEVALLHPRHGRHLAMRTGHVLGDHTTNTAERLASAVDTGRGGADVVLDDAPSRPRAGDAGEIDAELLRDPANDRGGLHALARRAATRSLQETAT